MSTEGYWLHADVAHYTEDAWARRRNFDVLPYVERVAAVRGLADGGLSEHAIAAACGVSVEQIRRVLAEREAAYSNYTPPL